MSRSSRVLLAGCLLAAALGGVPLRAQPAAEPDGIARLEQRGFPSVFQAWNTAERLNPAPSGPATALPDASRLDTFARHDVIIMEYASPWFGLRPSNGYPGLSVGFDPALLPKALENRRRILAANPSAVLLANLHYSEAPASYLPPDSPYWLREGGALKRDRRTKLESGGGPAYLDYHDAAWRDHVAEQCAAAVQSGVFDGCFFDWWRDEDAARVELAKAARQKAGEAALIVVNSNERVPSGAAPYLNGVYFEGFSSGFWPKNPAGWAKASEDLRWAAQNLRPPRLSMIEGWLRTSRDDVEDLRFMRALTALSLTQSDGAVLFGERDNTGRDHAHDWYPFWDKGLGRPRGPGTPLPDGTWRRSFEGGLVVFNPPGHGPVKVALPAPMLSRATGRRVRAETIAGSDGDIFTP